MAAYEYLVVDVEKTNKLGVRLADQWTRSLNALAAEGWRFVGQLQAGTMTSVAVMEREQGAGPPVTRPPVTRPPMWPPARG